MLVDTVYSSWPQLSTIRDIYDCHAGDSLRNCGGSGKVLNFLVAGKAAAGLLPYKIFMLTVTIFVSALQCLFLRVAAARGGEWNRSRNWLFWGWFVPFAFVYVQYMFPLEKVFMIDYDSRADQTVMMPYFSSNPRSDKFNMCTAARLCGLQVNINKAAVENLKDMFRSFTCRLPLVDVDLLFQNFHQMSFPDPCFE